MASIQMRMGLAIRQVDIDVESKAATYADVLPATHEAVLQGWDFCLRNSGGVLVRYEPGQFLALDPIDKQLEVNRCHAEALLGLDKAGQEKLDPASRQRLLWRAAGVVPSEESARYVEVASCGELSPHYMTSDAHRFVKGIGTIEKKFGQATALGYGFLLMAGVRSFGDLAKYGSRIEEFFDRVTDRPAVIGRLVSGDEPELKSLGHQDRLKLVGAIHVGLWQECGERPGRPFLLTQVIDGCLGLRKGGVGDALGLTVIDSIVAGKMGFPVRHLELQGHYFVEIAFSVNGIDYWDPLELDARVPVGKCRRISYLTLIIEGYLRLARGYVVTQRHADGERVARWVLEIKPELAEAHQILGECLLGLQQPRKALAESGRALELDPRLADAHVVQGNAFAMMNRWTEAINSYKKAASLRVGYAEVYNNLGLALAKVGQKDRALGAYNEATRIRPDYVEAHYNMGNLLMEHRELDRAIEAYTEAVKFSPRFAGAHYNLGQAYYAKGNMQSALQAYQDAVKANPKHAGAWNNMGIVYRDMGQEDKAVGAIEKAVSLNPNLLR